MAKAIDFSRPFRPEDFESPEPETPTIQAAPPAPAGPLDLEAVKAALVPYHKQVAEMKAQAAALKITDEASNKQVAELGIKASTAKKAILAIKDGRDYSEAYAFVDGVRTLINEFVKPLENDVERICKNKQAAWADYLRIEDERRAAAARDEARKQQEKVDAEQAAIRAEAERVARKAAEEKDRLAAAGKLDEATAAALDKTIEEETTAATSQAPIVVAPVFTPIQNKVRTGAGSSTPKRPWTYEITDINQVPRKYLMEKPGIIQADIKAGIREITGVSIFQKTQISYGK